MKKVLLIMVLSTLVMSLSAEKYKCYAATPPMGWNSFDGFITSINEEQFRGNVDYMSAHLKQFGYKYATIDAGWYQDGPGLHDGTNYKMVNGKKVIDLVCDKYGRLIPHPNLFPSSKGGAGFKPLAAYVHKKGLKFGLHFMRGMSLQIMGRGCKVKGTNYLCDDVVDIKTTCGWSVWGTAGVKVNHPAAQAWYNSLFDLLAEWGVDFVKYDDMLNPFRLDELRMIHKAVDHCGRKIIISLSPGDDTHLDDVDSLRKYSAMWRISSDFWDKWSSLKGNFNLLAQWNEHFPKTGWPDGDMLPIGTLIGSRPSAFTLQEVRSMMSVWCFARSPLILSCDLTKNPEDMLAIETQPVLLAINQKGTGNKVMQYDENGQIWTASVKGKLYLGMFNLSDAPRNFSYTLPNGVKLNQFVDIWTGKPYLRQGEQVSVTLAPHDCCVLQIK